MSYEDNNPFAADGPSTGFSNQSEEYSQNLYGYSPEQPNKGLEESQETSQEGTAQRPSSHLNNTHVPVSRISALFENGKSPPLTIIDAGKSLEGSGNYVTYTIKIGDYVVRRRYSEFDSLRNSLVRLYPTVIVPPIPEKQSMADYAVIGASKQRSGAILVEHRKRMLQLFLTRCCNHPRLRNESVLHRFLDSNVSWSEVLNSPPLSLLPKNILQAPPLDPATASESEAHSHLPTPSAGSRPKYVTDEREQAFVDSEAKAKEYETLITGGIEKCNRRILKRLADLSSDLNDLGATFNSFSLTETGALAAGIEKIGQASDHSFVSTTEFVHALSMRLEEPLAESAQVSHTVRQLLKYRRSKQLQLTMTEDSLTQKRATLDALEKNETEARRIEGALSRPQQDQSSVSAEEEERGQGPLPEYVTSSSARVSPKKSSGFKVFGKLNNVIHGVMDVDPETTRRNSIGKTREKISQLEQALEVAKRGAQEASDNIEKELQIYEKERLQDLRKLLDEAWEEAQREIERA